MARDKTQAAERQVSAIESGSFSLQDAWWPGFGRQAGNDFQMIGSTQAPELRPHHFSARGPRVLELAGGLNELL
jgi:hypothetical protein